MIAEIICVGTELLLGDILNTNAQYLSRELAALGVDVYYETTVGDNAARLRAAIALARSRCDIIIFSGGLGPTDDDITKEIAAEAFDEVLVFSQNQQDKIEAFFANSGRTCPMNNTKQAMIPQKGICIDNANGTAPGAIFIDKGQYAIVLPGPPNECVPMFANSVVPYLAKLTNSTMVSLTLRETGIGESHLQDVLEKYLDADNPTVALYAKTAEVHVRITAKADDKQKAKDMCEDTAKCIEKELGDYLYGYNEDSLEASVVKLLTQKGLTVSTAESCTGGMVSARLTSVSGASAVIAYGACTYTGKIKHQILGVSEDTLASYGEVSSEVAVEMARGVARVAASDIGLGITGIAGPTGGTKDKPVGLVYIAVADKNDVYVYKMLHTQRSRDTVRENAVVRALDMIRRLASGMEMRGCDKR